MSKVVEIKQSATKLSEARISPLAGKPAPRAMLVDLARLEKEHFDRKPDLEDANQFVVFGTSGHRGSSLNGTFAEAHVLAITQAICDYRKAQGITGPLYMGKDTHALSSPAQCSALEVLAANNVETVIQEDDGVTPTPVISHAILVCNRTRQVPGRTAWSSHLPTILRRTGVSSTTRPTAARPIRRSRAGCRIGQTISCEPAIAK